MKNMIINKTLALALIGFIGIQILAPKAHSALAIPAVAVHPGLSILLIMGGGALTITALTEISDGGWNLRRSTMLFFGLLALDDKSGTCAFQEITPDLAKTLNLSQSAVNEFNQQRPAINAFNQSLSYQILSNNGLSEEDIATAKKEFFEYFSTEVRLVAAAISKQAIQEMQR